MKSRVDLGLEKKFSIVAALFFGVSLASFVAIRGYVYADSTTSAPASVIVPDVCTISGVVASGNEHTATVTVGTVKTDIGSTDVSVICNDRNGFSVYAVGYSNNTEGNTNLIGGTTSLTIPTGTTMDASVSNWSMKLSPVSGTYAPTILSDSNGAFSSYHVIPATPTKVLTYTGDINVSSASQFNTTYAVAVSPSQLADTYAGKVKYTVVHPNYSNADGSLESYPVNLSFGTNTSSIVIDDVTYTSSSAAPELDYGTHTISATFPSGYELDSWSTTGNVSIASSTSNPTTMSVTGPGTLTLAGRQSCVHTTITGTMQDFKPCSSIANGTTGTLTDSRDGTSYAVGKLADGKFWLLDNLALDLTNSTVLNALSASNTNASADSLTSLRFGNRAAGDQYANGALGNLTIGFNNSVALVNADYKDQTQPLAMEQSGTGKIGVYYNYCAASAGSYCYGNGAENYGSPSGNATEDICPAGWRMPTGEYQALLTTLNNDKAAFVNALRTPLSGDYVGSAYSQGEDGYFWSSRRADYRYMYRLNVSASNVSSSTSKRNVGYSVRCILGS